MNKESSNFLIVKDEKNDNEEVVLKIDRIETIEFLDAKLNNGYEYRIRINMDSSEVYTGCYGREAGLNIKKIILNAIIKNKTTGNILCKNCGAPLAAYGECEYCEKR